MTTLQNPTTPSVEPLVPRTPTSAPVEASGGIDWMLILAVIGTAAALVSAVAIIATGLYKWWKRKERAADARRDEQVAVDIAEMGDTITKLNTLVTSLADEVRGRAPRPQLRFRVKDAPSPSFFVRIAATPAVDVEAIVATERAAALATMPPRSTKPPSDVARRPGTGVKVSRLQEFAKAAQLAGSSGLGQGKYAPITEEHRGEFESEVDNYEQRVRRWVGEWMDYLERRRLVVPLVVQVDNEGGAPAEDARIKLHFPSPCRSAELPTRPDLPVRPKFKRRLTPLYGALSVPSLDYGLRSPLYASRTHFELPNPNSSGPHYEDGSVRVSFWERTLPHHDTVRLDTIVVGVPEPGVYDVDWSIGAKNLAHLEQGTLQLEVKHEEQDPTPLTTIGELVKARHGVAGAGPPE